MQNYLNIHKINTNEDYYMGVFLTGAYQEILGDLHNLFGDTDAVHVDVISDNNYRISHVVEGDSVQEVLSYLEYSKPNLLEKVREACEISINQKKISNKEARLLLSFYEKGLSGYTYLEPDES
jgi:arginine decarboxylase